MSDWTFKAMIRRGDRCESMALTVKNVSNEALARVKALAKLSPMDVVSLELVCRTAAK